MPVFSVSTTRTTHSGSLAACVPSTVVNRTVLSKVDTVVKGPNVRDYRKAIADGRSATTSMEGSKYTFSAGAATYAKRMKPSSPYYASQGCSSMVLSRGQNRNSLVFVDASKTMSAEAEGAAASQLLQSLISAQTSFRGGTFLAEFAETVRMLRRPLDMVKRDTWRLIRRVDSMKGLFRRDGGAYGDMLSNAWLSWSFGVKPAMQDVQELSDAIESMRQLQQADTTAIRGTGRHRTVQRVASNQGTPDMDLGVHDVDLVRDYSVRYRGAIRATPMGNAQLLAHFGFTPEDIVPTVWEMIPWSFLVDYFVNVNEKLESLRWATADIAWMQRTVRNTATRVTSNLRPDTSPNTVAHFNVTARGGAAYAKHTWFQRMPWVYAPYPPWRFSLPVNPAQLINIHALKWGILRSNPQILDRISPGNPS